MQVQEKDMNFIVSHQTALFLLQVRNNLITWKSRSFVLRVKQVKEYIRRQYSFSQCEDVEDCLDMIIEEILGKKVK